MTGQSVEEPRSTWAGTPRADRISASVIGGGFLIAAVGLAVTTSRVSSTQWLAFVLLILVYVLAYRTEYVHPEGATVPTEPVLVAMLFLIPVSLVPLAVLIAQFASGLPRRPGIRATIQEAAVRLISGWHCLGPVAVFLIVGIGAPDLARWPIYLVALASQFLLDLTSAMARMWATGRPLGPMFRPMAWTFGVDILLAVIGMSAVIAGRGSLITVVLVAVPAILIALLIYDRRGLAEKEVHLGRAVEDAREEARIDPLTGLGNRRAWYEAVAAAEQLVSVVGSDLVVGIMAADMNHLKYANDSLGHEVGDQLIKAMADVTRSVAPPGSTVCRVGGDEFAVLVLGTAGQLDMTALVNRLRTAVMDRGMVAGCRLSAALGSALCPPELTLAEAFRAADSAVFAEKRAQRSSRLGDGPPPAQRTSSEFGASALSD